MAATLCDLLPRDENVSNDTLLGRFLEYAEGRRLTLYPAQESALLELFEEKNVILNTPTGSGKSLVAAALHFKAIAQGHRSIYTCPIKALVNEKFMALCREFGPDRVGLSTGDASVNRDAPILCCTAEILANIALREGAEANVQDVVMDEFHYYADRERGVAWQIPLLTLPQTRFLLMSATLGDTTFFEEELTRLNRRPTVAVSSTDRPVPLSHEYSELPLAKTLETLAANGRAPVYVVHFTQLEAAQSAQDFTSLNVCTREEKAALANALEGFKFSSPYGPDIKKWLRHGIGLHHAGLLPKYRVLIEQLAQKGLLKIICGTDTLGVGINVPIRTVLFTRLCKYDGQKTGILSARDFHQIAGRAGRKGFDDRGWVVAQAPEHAIENLKLAGKAARDGKKTVKRQPPEKNFVNWDKNTFARLIVAPPERLTSRFQVTHGMLLNVLSREGDGCRAMQQLIARCHDTPRQKKEHTKRAWQLFRSLVERKIIEIIKLRSSRREEAQTGTAAVGDQTPEESQSLLTSAATGQKLRVNVELQEDFSMDQALSLYLLDTIPLVDPQQPDYALILLTLVESILEDPDIILRKQLDKVKDQRMAEMKFEGIEYDKRMEELEKLEYPKPNREFIYSTFNAFADKHPWVGQENIRPKSIAREMFESFRSFSDYIRDYELQRAEGVLLRHLNRVYKVLTQNVPDAAKNDQVREMEIYLGSMIRQVDSSLLDEWEKMRDPNFQRAETKEVRPAGAEEAAQDVTRDTKAFTAAIRNRIFVFLRGLVIADYESALESLGEPLTPARSPSAGERENFRQARSESETDDSRKTVEQSGDERRLSPLPRGGGEGQGEGERAKEAEHRTPNIEHPTSNAPLTPALSPSEGERENLRQPRSESETDDSRKTVEQSGDERRLSPLPRGGGEGQGEGERAKEAEHRTPNIEHPTSNVPLTPALSPSEGEREDHGEPWSAARLQQVMDAYLADHGQLLLSPEARNLRHTYVTPAEDKKSWRVQQMLVDPEEHNDWVAEFEVDLAQSRALGEPALRLRRIASLG